MASVYDTNKSKSSKIFQTLLTIFFIIVSFICLFPFLNEIAISLSSPEAIMSGLVSLIPVDTNWSAYFKVLGNPGFLKSFNFTVVMTITYTLLTMGMTIIAAYPLSRKELKGRGVIMALIIFTMYFDGGIIPNYLVVKNLGLLDSMWSLILPGAISAYNLIILRTFFSGIDKSLTESAYLDGCSEIGTMLRIIIPLSAPAIATLSLFYAVGRWNGFSDAVFYISDSKKFPLQLKLREMILMEQISQQEANQGASSAKSIADSVKAASVILTTIPILLVYPFLQKYFTKGIMLGSIKG